MIFQCNSIVASIIQNAAMHQSAIGHSNYFEVPNLDTGTGEFNAMLQTDLGHSNEPGSSPDYIGTGDQSKTPGFLPISQVKGGLNRAEGPMYSDRGLLHRYVFCLF